MKKVGTIRTIAFILLLLVLLPVLVYSIYEINALSTGEELVAEIYRRQLDVVLFSVNQYAWDVVNNWASTLTVTWNEAASQKRTPEVLAGSFLQRNRAVDAFFVADSLGKTLVAVGAVPGGRDALHADFRKLLSGERERVERLLRFSRQNYRKIEPVTGTDSTGKPARVVLVFVMRDRTGAASLAGIRLDEAAFVNEVLAERLREVAGEDFLLGVIRQPSNQILFATAETTAPALNQRRQLWLFPDLAVGIRLSGATIEEIARSRFTRDLAILVVLDLLLLAGVWVVFRSVRKEMEFVQLKSDFVSNVSHELRTPLALIRMYAETLEMGRVKTETRKQEYYSTIVRESDRLTRLVNNLLNFSRMEAGRKPYVLVPTDLNTVVRTILESFGPHLRSEGFTPIISLDPALPVVHADAEAVQEAVINVVDNAVKYSGEVRFLRVATGVDSGNAFVEVQDRGIGIAADHQPKIFETFYRVGGGLVHTTKGSGLGLSITKHIMEAHGGRIDLRSAPGEGSTFRLLFPLGG